MVDYNAPDWEASIKDVDAVIDMVGGAVLTKTWRTVKSQSIIITVADPPPAWALDGSAPVELETYPGVKYKYFVLSQQRGAWQGSEVDR